MILIPSVSAERAAGVTSCRERPTQRNNLILPVKAPVSQSSALTDGTKIVLRGASEKPQSGLANSGGEQHNSPAGGRHAGNRTCSMKIPWANRSDARNHFLFRGDTDPLNDLPRHAEIAS